MVISAPVINWSAIGVLLIVTAAGISVIIESLIPRHRDSFRLMMSTVIIGLAAAIIFSVTLWGESMKGFGGMILIDTFTLVFYTVILAGALLTVFLMDGFVKEHPFVQGEILSLLCFSTVGMLLAASAGDLVIVFLGIEILSISFYILAGVRRTNPYSLEAALKYFLLGAFASGFLLFGIAYIFGATGSTNIERICSYIANSPDGPSNFLHIGVIFFIIGIGFKIALVPFHMWVPDVYEGSPSPIAAFMSTGVKAAGFAVLVRVIIFGLGGYFLEWRQILWVLAVLTMTAGNIIALVQDNVKRMLAYSSIAHAGYILIGFTAGSPEGISSVVYYAAVYTAMNLGAFGVVSYFESSENRFPSTRDGEERGLYSFRDYAGLRQYRPVIAAAMALFMFSLAGIPPTAGFFAKFFVFRAAVNADLTGLAVIGALNAVVSVYYYLRVILYMYMRTAENDYSLYSFRPFESVTLIICSVGVLLLGFLPSLIINIPVWVLF